MGKKLEEEGGDQGSGDTKAQNPTQKGTSPLELPPGGLSCPKIPQFHPQILGSSGIFPLGQSQAFGAAQAPPGALPGPNPDPAPGDPKSPSPGS